MIVTSFSQKGYHEYGKNFIISFLENWSDEKLVVYYENNLPRSCPKDTRIEYVNLCERNEFIEFCKTISESDPLFKGLMRNVQDSSDKQPVYNFRFDAFKFFRKVYAIKEANLYCSDRTIAWVDADVIFHSPVPENFVNDTLDGSYLAYLGRAGLYSECGYMAFNRSMVADHDTFMQLYWDVYRTGAFRYLGEWHDCYVFDFVREVTGVPSNNLAKGLPADHPFVHSVLGKYMDHIKGPQRKELGYSPELKDKKKEVV